jgi:hypothetical protein
MAGKQTPRKELAVKRPMIHLTRIFHVMAGKERQVVSAIAASCWLHPQHLPRSLDPALQHIGPHLIRAQGFFSPSAASRLRLLMLSPMMESSSNQRRKKNHLLTGLRGE